MFEFDEDDEEVREIKRWMARWEARLENLRLRYEEALTGEDALDREIAAGRVLNQGHRDLPTRAFQDWRKKLSTPALRQRKQRKLVQFADGHPTLLDQWRSCGVERLKVIASLTPQALARLQEQPELLKLSPKKLSRAFHDGRASEGQKAYGFGVQIDACRDHTANYLAWLEENDADAPPELAAKVRELIGILQQVVERP